MQIPRLAMLIVIAVAALQAGSTTFKTPTASALTNCSVSDLSIDAEEQGFLTNYLNPYRSANGLAPLTMAVELNRASSWMAVDLATHTNFSHIDSLGRDPFQRMSQCDAPVGSQAENIAGGYDTASAVFQGWKNSAGHNANMLSSAYTYIGVARACCGQNGWYWVTNFSSAGTPIGGSTPAAMNSPAPGSGLAGATQQFTWSATGATGYAIYAGSSLGAYNYFSSLFNGNSGTVTGLPTNGSTVWIRLWTNFNGTWLFNDYQYTAANGGGGTKATIVSPAPNTTLGGASQIFTWTAAQGATGYAIYAGSSAGAYNYFSSLFNGNSSTVTGLPTNGSIVWIRLWTNLNGTWLSIDYQYAAANGGGGGTKATMVSPAPNTTLGGASQAFTWTAAQGATGYAIYAGSSAGAYNYFSSLFNGTSSNVPGLPTNGSAVWIRLWTNFNGAWQFNDYQYTAANAGGGSPATMISPAPNSNIGGTVNFTWTAAAGTTGFALYVGTAPGGYNIYGALVSGTSQSVANVPAGTIYVRLWTNFAGGWQFIDYTYQ